MKNKIVIITLFIVAIFIAVGVGFYFIQKNNKLSNSLENTLPPIQPENNSKTNSEAPQNILVTDDFGVSLPEGWRRAEPTIGVSAMAVKIDDKFNDPAAQKINFRSYFAVSYDTLQGKSLGEYLQGAQGQLQQTISSIVFAQEHDAIIDDKSARAFEANFTRQGVNFKILMVAVKGANDDVWIMSFNTLQSTWDEYQKVFSDIANSFRLKLKK